MDGVIPPEWADKFKLAAAHVADRIFGDPLLISIIMEPPNKEFYIHAHRSIEDAERARARINEL